MIYLDHAATTGQKPEAVLQAITESMNASVNAGRGSYAAARKAMQVIDDCRQNLLDLAQITSGYHVFFAASATLVMNQIILGLPLDQYSALYVSPFEHNAVMRPLYAVSQRHGCQLHALPFIPESWTFDAEEAESMFITRKPDYVFVSLVSNTTGYILPVKQIVALAHQYGARVIVDCAQALGAVDENYASMDADAYVFAGHKTLYGPYGIAGMILKDGWKITPGLFGGTGSDSLNLHMPAASAGGYEPGSANLPAICGLNAAISWLKKIGVRQIEAHERNLVQVFIDQAMNLLQIKLYAPPVDRRSGIIAFNVEGYQSNEVGTILDDDYAIAVRTGYQCAPWIHDWLHTKQHMGIVRMSVSYFTTLTEIETMIAALKTL